MKEKTRSFSVSMPEMKMKKAWEGHAKKYGYRSLSRFIRKAVEARINLDIKRGPNIYNSDD